MHLAIGLADPRRGVIQLYDTQSPSIDGQRDNQHNLLDSLLQLNNSRLVTWRTQWRPDLPAEVARRAALVRQSLEWTGQRWIESFVMAAVSESLTSMLDIADDVYVVLETALLNASNETMLLMADGHKLADNVLAGYQANAFFAKTVYELGGGLLRDIPFDALAHDAWQTVHQHLDRLLHPVTGETDSFSRAVVNAGRLFKLLADELSQWMGDNWQGTRRFGPEIAQQFDAVVKRLAEDFDRVRLFYSNFPALFC